MIDVKKEDRVITLTINRPEALNAANNCVFAGIRDGLLEAEADSGRVRSIQNKFQIST